MEKLLGYSFNMAVTKRAPELPLPLSKATSQDILSQFMASRKLFLIFYYILQLLAIPANSQELEMWTNIGNCYAMVWSQLLSSQRHSYWKLGMNIFKISYHLILIFVQIFRECN